MPPRPGGASRARSRSRSTSQSSRFSRSSSSANSSMGSHCSQHGKKRKRSTSRHSSDKELDSRPPPLKQLLLAPILAAKMGRQSFALSPAVFKKYCKFAVGVAMKPSDRKSAFDDLPVINSCFASLPVVDPKVVATLKSLHHPFVVQDAHLHAIQQMVVETNGLLAFVAQALESGDLQGASSYLE